MLADGLFERWPVGDVYAIHNFPSLPQGTFVVRNGPVMASEDNFEIVIEGVGHHAAMPHRGVDPIVVASQVVLGLQTVVSRNLDPADDGVISVTEFITDGTVNAVPSRVTLRGDTRSFAPGVQTLIRAGTKRVAEGICAAHDAVCHFRYRPAFDPTINTSAKTKIAASAARLVVGSCNVTDDFQPPMTSEDVAFMLQARPGCYVLLGNDGPGGCGLHNPGYDFNDAILTTGADFWVTLAESVLKV